MWIEATRGGRVESRHRVDVAVCDTEGNVVHAFGDPTRPTQPRSAIKPIQALPAVLTGAADAYEITQAELAMLCSSHNGEPAHVDMVLGFLERVGSGPDELKCGAHRPLHEASADAMVRAGISPGAEHSNCSGKHAGFLATAHHLGENPAGYLEPRHRVQERVTAMIAEMTSHTLTEQSPGIDGCGIPVWTVPLGALATSWARLARVPVPNEDIGAASNRLLDAMAAEPWFVAGTGRSCTRIITERAPRVVVKGGAEGVYCGVDRGNQLGIALKTDDGSKRGSELAIEAAIRHVLGESPPDPTPLYNVAGTMVGEVRLSA